MLVRVHMQGFSSQRAHRALIATHDCGTEPALGWLVENADKLDLEVDEQQHMSSQPSEGPSVGETTSCSTAQQLKKSQDAASSQTLHTGRASVALKRKAHYSKQAAAPHNICIFGTGVLRICSFFMLYPIPHCARHRRDLHIVALACQV